MPRTIWSGSLTFGLLNIPVKLATAVRSRALRFHLLHDDDGVRLETKRVCPQDGQEVPWDHVVKGYEVAKNEYVVFTKEELHALEAEATRAIEIEDFVDFDAIDPVYFESTYYLVPDKGAQRAYGLLRSALEATRKVGIGRAVMRGKTYLVAVRAKEDALVLETMHLADEVVPVASALEGARVPETAPERELAMAKQIVETLSAAFEPGKYKDEHRERVLAAVEQKAKGKKIVVPPEAKKPTQAKDILAALEASLSAARERGKQR